MWTCCGDLSRRKFQMNPRQPTKSTLLPLDHCPHCQAPVVGWKRRWFRDNTYHCAACGGDSRPEFRAPSVVVLVSVVVFGMLRPEFERRGLSFAQELCVLYPVVFGPFILLQHYQPLRKIMREKPLSYPVPDPNPRECGSCGITLKRGRRDCHWCGWKPKA
jgi:hypothetical protein